MELEGANIGACLKCVYQLEFAPLSICTSVCSRCSTDIFTSRDFRAVELILEELACSSGREEEEAIKATKATNERYKFNK